MTTLAAEAIRKFTLGEYNDLPVIAADVIYKGAAVGDNGAGYVRPLAGGDPFRGFAIETANNAAGAAGDVVARTVTSGRVQLSVAGAVITDVGLPVYASDDDTFTFIPTGGSFVGFATRWVSSGIVEVTFDAKTSADPWAGWTAETVADNKTLDALDTGKLFVVTVDAKAITLPAVAGAVYAVMNGGAFGTVAVNVSPNANDGIGGPDLTAADNKDLINTKATANRGDYAIFQYGDATGWVVSRLKGTWAIEG